MFDDFFNLDTIEQKLKYFDDKFTPIVFGVLAEYRIKWELSGNLAKDFSYNEDEKRFDISWSLQETTKWPGVIKHIVKIHLHSDRYAIDLLFPDCWPIEGLSSGLSREDLTNSLDQLTKKARSQRD